VGASVGFLGEAAKGVGAQLVGALPQGGGLNAMQMLAQPPKALLLLNVEPVLDMGHAQAAQLALDSAGIVVAMTAFKDAAVEGADVLLPITPFTETAGTFVNAEGRAQAFVGVVPPAGAARPAWKVLRVLANLLGLEGFAHETADEVRAEALGDLSGLASRLSNATSGSIVPYAGAHGLQRLADIPIYSTDALVRHAASLQQTVDARAPQAGLPPALAQAMGVVDGDWVKVTQGPGSARLRIHVDATLAENTVRVPAGHPDTASLGTLFGGLSLERMATDLEVTA
jgi:NADH-quinone oxidoreductase subunit G